jgi:hypothetical protein
MEYEAELEFNFSDKNRISKYPDYQSKIRCTLTWQCEILELFLELLMYIIRVEINGDICLLDKNK